MLTALLISQPKNSLARSYVFTTLHILHYDKVNLAE
jgi:hypothetical protein